MMYKELKRKVEQDKIEMKQFALKLNNGKPQKKELFEIEPDQTNVLVCAECGIDTFYVWVEEKKKRVASNTYWLRCTDKKAELIKEKRENYEFYFKYSDAALNIFFKRIEGHIMNPNYIDCGTIKALLLKVDEWPDVITKQDLHEEGKECIFYGNSSKEHPKDPQDLLKYVIPTIKFNNDPLYPRELNQLKSAVKNNKSDSDSSESESLKSEPEEKIQTVTKKQKKPAKKRELKNAKKQNELAVVLAEAVSESSESNGND